MNATTPITQDLVLVGGGHSHAIALEQFAMHPMPGVRLTLITDVSHTPYSGMLPGYVAGLYGFDECHIDLWPLAQRAGARLILDRATGLDLPHRQVRCAQHPPIAFDYLSIDIGSRPSTADIEGAEHLIPVKPISKFLAHWDALVEELRPSRAALNPSLQLAVVGAGAGGVELAFAIEARFRRLYSQEYLPKAKLSQGTASNSAPAIAPSLDIHLFQRGNEILPRRSRMMRWLIRQQLQQRRISLRLGQAITAVERVDPDCLEQTEHSLRIKTDRTALPCDAVFWVTGASAAPWIADSGLKTDAEGFIAVNTALQSSHPRVFAAGDIATMLEHPRPKAGVFAVRQGQPLYENLRRSLLGQPLKAFVPQQQFLILVGTGDGRAIASRGPFALGPSPLLWRWKDHIDRAFMARFAPGETAEAMASQATQMSQSADPPDLMHCRGCGAKVGSAALSTALNRLRAEQPETAALGKERGVVLGLEAAEDAAVLRPPADQLWVQTVDYFPALVEDPFRLGQITAHHCLNDLWAMGASPHSVLAIATLPYATPAKHEELLYHLLSGLTQVLSQEGAVLLGGHTVEGEQMALGLTCNGTVHPNHLLTKSGLGPDQSLILSKPLGTGTLFAAAQQQRAKGRWLEGAIASMACSNAAAAACLREHGAAACTDITGFGLLGHLLELVSATAKASPDPSANTPLVGITLSLADLPLLDGAADTLSQGIVSSLSPQNRQAEVKIRNRQQVAHHPLFPILFDPQTAGGLLAAVPKHRAEACVTALQHLGYVHSAIVGQVNAIDPRDPQDQAATSPVTIEV
ncbi:MAG: selenide, water dikinase SelD [Elainellaceae cyanobacterium]